MRSRSRRGLWVDVASAEADVRLRQALDFYRSVGASWYVRQAEELLPASA